MAWQDLFPGVPEDEWRDWRWQQRAALTTLEDFERIVRLTDEEREGFARTKGRFRTGATPYYASLIDPTHPHCPVRRQVLPLPAEAEEAAGDRRDPTGEEPHRPVRALVQKYPDRALLLATDRCAAYCRHCTRRRITGAEANGLDRAALSEAVGWLGAHAGVREVIVSGGDPLVLSDGRVEEILAAVRSVPHVRIVRLATRAPVTNPFRVTEPLARLLRRFAPLYVVTHFNHPKELTAEARAGCERLVDHGVPVENQSVLLRGINSSARALVDLNQRLLEARVRPYYLHQGDLAAGTAHLRTPLRAGVEILAAMRGRTSGLAIPHLAVDLPGGEGKIALAPDYVEAREPAGTWLRGPRGGRAFYPDPASGDCSCPYDAVYYAPT
ncbi:MAG TPA: KamA family radical SAM protein [Anaeromyxobacteraceae bacterium]|nr:KamA family radical SAM protein [Anaeromyxobacteraceae bacterium]